MGDWRTVNIVGRMDAEEAKRMIAELQSNDIWETPAWGFRMHYSLCGLNQWVEPDGTINGTGNLAERDCEIDDVQAGLEYLATWYPSINLVLHAGGNYEDEACVATFIVQDGIVRKEKPQVMFVKNRWDGGDDATD